MKLFAFILLASVMFCACEKNKDNSSTDQLGGAYAGTFNRTGMDTANVIIHFTGNTFNGTSDHTKYPAICHGSYEMGQHQIAFVDSCSWTADFDWTLILNGSFELSYLSDGRLRIAKTTGVVTDEYLLRKLAR